MADFPAFLTFEQVVDHVLRVMGLDKSDILDLLNEHARAGNLHVTGKDAEFVDDVPRIFAQGQEFAQRQEIPTLFFEETVTFKDPDDVLITEVRHTFKIGKDALGECCVWRRLRDSWKDLGWTSIRFPREEIFRLWPLPTQVHNSATIKGGTGLPGRPGSKHLWEKEFQRRCDANEVEPICIAEARYLAKWFHDNYPEEPEPQPKSISNAIRGGHTAWLAKIK